MIKLNKKKKKKKMKNKNSDIPVVDFGSFISENECNNDKKNTSNEINEAIKNFGFVYLKNFGISKERLNKVFELSENFFTLDKNQKEIVKRRDHESNCGYVALGVESLDPKRKTRDQKEAYNIGNFKERNKFGNMFPPNFEGGEELCSFYDDCDKLLNRFLFSLEIALNFEKSYFVNGHTKQDNMMRLLCYPSIVNEEEKGNENKDNVRAGQHVDYGSATLLFRNGKVGEIDGLEVLSNGNWINAPIIEDTVLINVGALMEIWTVILPKSKSQMRLSIAYFGHPNFEENIHNLFKEEKSLYEPVNSLDFLLNKLKNTY
eukprot:TRINITY_DN9275_c0_g1_i1.p1 TRINITY_DN9275_c0_g1~~TRINITY_DN9275_c0_g1_i1.p1  ORF type:complete len:318 (-),score=82.86 TRINITY_DN9275_c0_g1_i1:30-983(-)